MIDEIEIDFGSDVNTQTKEFAVGLSSPKHIAGTLIAPDEEDSLDELS